ncbi:hypothetical protein RZS08_16185, partial [Arthrospira platensis SPKY1]|nr:hypothetical protein [Arthrospira platensis SPKY1]
MSKHKNPRDIYVEKLIADGIINQDYIKSLEKEYKSSLEQNLEASRQKELTIITPFMQNEWNDFIQVSDDIMRKKVDTTFDRKTLDKIAEGVTNLPEDKKFIAKIKKIIEDRKQMYANDSIDWGLAETLAYGSLLSEGYHV